MRLAAAAGQIAAYQAKGILLPACPEAHCSYLLLISLETGLTNELLLLLLLLTHIGAKVVPKQIAEVLLKVKQLNQQQAASAGQLAWWAWHATAP